MQKLSDPPFGTFGQRPGQVAENVRKMLYGFCPSDTWTPSVNLYETEDAYRVCVDLAGVEKDKIDLTVASGRLTLTGARPVPRTPDPAGPPDKSRVHLMEIDHGTFCREVDLPADVDEHRINAQYRNGLLWIDLPKK